MIGLPIFGLSNSGVDFKTSLKGANLEGANLQNAILACEWEAPLLIAGDRSRARSLTEGERTSAINYRAHFAIEHISLMSLQMDST
ncbi:MAG: hypothetical protein QNJ41_27500 [Xenococcaceae cyanobacterium MO_188.B32]|nr:hypothetical protein [Xenococcaceae cyanobacterium MO_188.B32]